ncbi:hypothetical protein [Streptomyces sp. NPDC020996]|uniref:hypothetical protein n=1 Tax=Streptomyces sp. NPDC020996 TaxID=3154791 RepID=UPI0033FA6B92
MSTSDPPRPHRWDLLRPDQLGTLLDGVEQPDLWYLDELTVCAAKVVARSGCGDLRFVGRSADSLFDLLGGALAETSWSGRLGRLPLSCAGGTAELSRRDVGRMREHLAAAGAAPWDLARRRRPLALVDLVWAGRTFTTLHTVLRDWVEESREPRPVVRSRLRCLGITVRTGTSPKTWRWQQHRSWTRDLPARAVQNVSLDRSVWHLLADQEPKTAPSFPPRRWHDDAVSVPARGVGPALALATAVALVEAGRTGTVRRRLVRTFAAEPAFAEPWLRSLSHELKVSPEPGPRSSGSPARKSVRRRGKRSAWLTP